MPSAALTIPTPDVALTRISELTLMLGECMRLALEAQFEIDDLLEQLINSKIGSPNEMTGKPHSYTSAETWAKNTPQWRDARRAVIRADFDVEDVRAQLSRAKLIARLAVIGAEQQVAA